MIEKELFHIPVLVEEVCKYLVWEKNGVYIDGTVGGGGHTVAFLDKVGAQAKVIGIDQDEEALHYVKNWVKDPGNRFIYKRGNFSQIDLVIKELGYGNVHGIFLDLGVSSHQIDTAARGFSYRLDGPLDMRMSSEQALTAKTVIHSYPEKELVRIFKKYGEEKFAQPIVKRIVRERQMRSIDTTFALKELICSVVTPPYQVKTLSRIFQALRIEINQELSALKAALAASLSILIDGGRLVVISYHSLEDRIVKQFFRREEEVCICPQQFPECVCGKKKRLEILTKKAIRPNDAEVQTNARARSAKLRAAQKCVR